VKKGLISSLYAHLCIQDRFINTYLKTKTIHLLEELLVLLSQLTHAQAVHLLGGAGLIQQRGILHAQLLTLLQVVAA